jgi:heterodisulfide reductase subunit A2
VVAACTPKTHEPLFQETLVNAGLNKYLFEMTNIRNQDSWVHKEDPKEATEKAKDLVRMAVAKVPSWSLLKERPWTSTSEAWSSAAAYPAWSRPEDPFDQGYQVDLIEREPPLGGQASTCTKPGRERHPGKM